MMTNKEYNNDKGKSNNNTSNEEHQEFVKRKELYLRDLKKRLFRLKELKKQEESDKKMRQEKKRLQINEKQKLYRQGRKERDYLTISVVLLLVAFGFGVVAVNHYTNFNGTILG